jgi:hypothetical protein
LRVPVVGVESDAKEPPWAADEGPTTQGDG